MFELSHGELLMVSGGAIAIANGGAGGSGGNSNGGLGNILVSHRGRVSGITANTGRGGNGGNGGIAIATDVRITVIL